MEESKLVEWLCSVLDDTAQDLSHRIDAGIVLLQHAARMRSPAGISGEKKLGVTLATAVRGKLVTFVTDDKQDISQRIRAASVAL